MQIDDIHAIPDDFEKEFKELSKEKNIEITLDGWSTKDEPPYLKLKIKHKDKIYILELNSDNIKNLKDTKKTNNKMF